MSKAITVLRKFAAILVGVPIIILGIVLIPLPGPGLLIVFAGLFILAQEFEAAKKYSDKAQAQIKKIYHDAKSKSENISSKKSDN